MSPDGAHDGVLVVAEARRGELREVSLELITAALSCAAAGGGPVRVAALGNDAGQFAPTLAERGVDEVLTVAVPCQHFEAHVWGRALEALIEAERPRLVLTGFTVDSMGFASAVAARKRLGFASDVFSIAWDGRLRAQRGMYGDKLQAELEFPDKACSLLMVRPGAFAPASAGLELAPTRAVPLDLSDAARTQHIGFAGAATGDLDITDADFLVSIGRGVQDRDEIPRLEQLAERLGATLSASRPLVDAGWLPAARQVGQSGRTVKPRVYLALGISGAVQHLAGMRDAETIIAVNTDANAPIFGVAHYAAIADLFDVVAELEQTLG